MARGFGLALIVAISLLGLFWTGRHIGAQGGQEMKFFVSTEGNDHWSGKVAAPNEAKTDGPFGTIARARDAIRELKAKGALAGPVSVQVRGGKYYLSEPILFGPEDSGTRECPISYVAYPGERPELIGGKKITGFAPAQGHILSVSLPEVKAGKWYFRSLFVDGERQIRARYPNFDPSDPYRKGFSYVHGGKYGLGLCVGCIHNPGDWMEYKVNVPVTGEYSFWVLYGALNKPFGNSDMAGRTTISVDGGAPVPLMDLPDTGSWTASRWSRSATLHLTAGERILKWQNVKGGGLNLAAYVLTDDPNWKAVKDQIPEPAPGKHMVLIHAGDFQKSHGSQLQVSPSDFGASKTSFCYKPGTAKPSWGNSPDAEVHIFPSSYHSCRAFMLIESLMKVDEATNTITVGGKECLCELRMGDRYFVENIFEELDSPGEWYLNKETGVLCLWPKGELSEKSEVVAPILGRVLDLEGASYIRLSGLEIRDTDYSPEDGCVGYGMGNDGAVYLAKSANCAIEDCRFLNVGKYAVCLSEGGDNRIVGNDIAQGAEGGILLLDSARNLVSDNHIHHCGLVYKHIGGVVLQGKGASDNAVSHNLVHDMSRYGITLKNPGLRNVVEFNHVCNLDTETYDTGGIEVTQHDRQLRTGSVIRNNIVHDVIGYSCTNDKDMFCAWGIYLDSFAGGYTVTSNIVYRNSHGGIMLQGGKGNRVENNIFVNSTKSQLYISNFSQNFEDEVVTGNIFYYTNPEAVLVGAGNLTDKVLTCDRNLYFLAGGKEIAIRGAGCKTFADWQKKGFDVNSIVADPMFVDPEKDDYTLRPESPAFKLGFKAIDTSQVGLLRKRCRCAIRPASEVFGWAQSR